MKKLKRHVKRSYVKKYDLQQLQNEDVKADFAIKGRQFLNSKGGIGAEQLAEVLNEAAREVIPKEAKINEKWTTTEMLELVMEKRLLRLRRSDSNQAMSRYKAKCNEVRKSAREDKRRWLKNICEGIERYHGEHRARKVHEMVRNINRKWLPRQTTVGKETGEVLTERSEILNRWSEHYSKLYEPTNYRRISDILTIHIFSTS